MSQIKLDKILTLQAEQNTHYIMKASQL